MAIGQREVATLDAMQGLKSEVFRPLASVVIPGTLALLPYVIYLAASYPAVNAFYRSDKEVFVAAVVSFGTIAGMLLENVGSSIERGIDQCIELEYLHGHMEVWNRYLKCQGGDSNARRYLGTIVTRLKFLNSLMPAIVILLIGVWVIQHRWHPFPTAKLLIVTGLCTLGLTWLFRTSTELSEVASITRFRMLGAWDQPHNFKPEAHAAKRQRHFAYVVGELVTSRGYQINLVGKSSWAVISESCKLFWLGRVMARPSLFMISMAVAAIFFPLDLALDQIAWGIGWAHVTIGEVLQATAHSIIGTGWKDESLSTKLVGAAAHLGVLVAALWGTLKLVSRHRSLRKLSVLVSLAFGVVVFCAMHLLLSPEALSKMLADNWIRWSFAMHVLLYGVSYGAALRWAKSRMHRT